VGKKGKVRSGERQMCDSESSPSEGGKRKRRKDQYDPGNAGDLKYPTHAEKDVKKTKDLSSRGDNRGEKTRQRPLRWKGPTDYRRPLEK